MFIDGQEWGGINEAHVLADGAIGIIGHIARYKNGKKEYYPIAGSFDPQSYSIDGLKIIAQRRHFPHVLPKQDNVYDCLFPGGIDLAAQVPLLYTGISDTHGGVIEVEHPFS